MRSVVLRTSKTFENCYDLLRSAQYYRRIGLVFSDDFDPVNEQFSENEEVDRDLQQLPRWEIAQRQRIVSLIASSTNYNIAD